MVYEFKIRSNKMKFGIGDKERATQGEANGSREYFMFFTGSEAFRTADYADKRGFTLRFSSNACKSAQYPVDPARRGIFF